ncbi:MULTISPECIES: YajQ family cyclic di-GMP-binding protein [Gammaproteobacteria]|uniref:YajQ family cyclic di-GMP-binding protein n=1 Tax=Gammaproteobacteria TaxID=1236 RepID=UPI000DD088F9|nr:MULTISPECIES: YajQ family cyclic di-GMP-binding protein [Gammaproteobacteria]RTE87628.1 YajQ family cyclic di-GMP-binding protein [Aliidiomarina sp. B3213]TCZ92587.1 YajQ family cyclic di-GMP-binding protein [Lysobacter sp. N42]
MPSFDIVSEIDQVELKNTVDNAQRELGTRFDFRNVEASFELNDLTVVLSTESDFQIQQMVEILRNNATRRGISLSGTEMDDEPTHSGKTYSLRITFKQGIDSVLAKKIVKMVKESKLKVQASIQGEKVRITGKKRDDLQQTIALMKASDIELPLQYENFRD